ncbi:hypothetical protein RIF29_21912 [Crotalaria pallida]|uniref:Uncharacterized protein n=1 Tax=Crotalaria pallida TaxID=3830 RepID=A0AAN9F5M6_CROPI
MSSARVLEKFDEEKDLLDRSTKKPKGDASGFSYSSTGPISYDDVVEEPRLNSVAPLTKSFVHALEGKSSGLEGVNGDHKGRGGDPLPSQDKETFDGADFTGRRR